MLKLFYAPGSCSLATHIALEEVGADYEAMRVDFRSAEQTKPDYLAINPNGRVPALVTEQGTLTENPAILLYLAAAFPEADLAPFDDPFRLGKIASLNAYLSCTLHVAHAHRFRGYRWADDEAAIKEMARKSLEVVETCFVHVEKNMFEGPFAVGNTYTIADCYLFNFTTWMEADEVDLAKVPKLFEYRERLKERPAIRRALAAQKG